MKRLIPAVLAITLIAIPASAETCTQSDGQVGVYGTYFGTPTDADCITAEEYQQTFSAENLLAVGTIVGFTVNPDGTTTLDFGNGAFSTVVSNPLDRPVAANPELEPDAPTVREVLFPEYPATASRLSALIG